MRATQRLPDDGIDQLQALQILGGQAQSLGSGGGLGCILPQDRGTTFRRDHGIDGVFQHQHRITGGQCDRPTRTAFADDGGDDRHRRFQTGFDGPGNRLGLAAGFGVDTGERAGSIDETQHRQIEPAREFDQPACLAVAFRAGHAEIMRNPAFGIATFFRAQHHDGPATKPAQPTHDGGIVAKGPVPGQRGEIGNQPTEIIMRLGALRVARDLGLLPRRQLGISRAQLPISLFREAGDLLGDVDSIRLGEVPKLLDLAFKFGDRFFEVQVLAHDGAALAFLAAVVTRDVQGGDALPPAFAAAQPEHGCRSGLSRCRHGPAASANCADQPHGPACGWQRNGGEHAG